MKRQISLIVAVGVSVLLAFGVLTSISLAVKLEQFIRISQDTSARLRDSRTSVRQLQADYLLMDDAITRAMLDPVGQSAFAARSERKANAAAVRDLNLARSLSRRPDLIRVLGELRAYDTTVTDRLEYRILNLASSDPGLARYVYFNAYLPSLQHILSMLNRALKLTQNETENAERDLREQAAEEGRRAGGTIALLTLIGAISGLFLVRSVTRIVKRFDLAARSTRLMMEYSQDVIATFDEHGRFRTVSHASRKVWGYSPDELIGRNVMDLVHPDDRQKTIDETSAVIEGRNLEPFANRYIAKDGSVIDLMWSARWVPEEKTLFCVARDITDGTRAQAQIVASRERMRLIIDAAYDAFIAIDSNGVITHWNSRAEEIFGWNSFEAVGQPMHSLIVPTRYCEAHLNGLRRFRETGEGSVIGRPIQMPALHRNGHKMTVELTISSVQSGDEWVFNSFVRDITERRRAEQELEHSERRLSVAQSLAHLGSWEWDIATNAVTWSDELYRIFGLTTQEFGATYEAYVAFVHPEDRDLSAQAVAKALQERGSFSLEHRIVRKNGEVRVVSARGEVAVDAAGQPVRMTGAAHDVTEQKSAGETLRLAKETAEFASLAKSQFLANMSHEIRTPMNGVIGPVGLLLDSPLTAMQRELATIARSSAEALLNIINDILDLSKIEVGEFVIEPVPFDMLLLVEESTGMMAQRAEEKGIDLIVRYDPEAPRLLVGDAGRIRQVIANLVNNAIKFTHRGHVLVNVENVEQVQKNTGDAGIQEILLRVSVEDTGIGIEESKMERMFDRFTQADASTTREYGGSGLGLAISKELVQLMGGEMGASSTHSVGSTFWFMLRLLCSAKQSVSTLQSELAGLRVLIVDDSEVNRRVLHEQVVNWRFRNGSCASGEEAMRLLKAAASDGDPYRIAILDHHMPGMDGKALARGIKADPLLRQTVLVMLTSLGRTASEDSTSVEGIAAYLTKPARQSELWNVLHTAWVEHCTGSGPDSPLANPKSPSELAEQTSAYAPMEQQWAGARILLAEDHSTNQRVVALMLGVFGCSVDVASDGQETVKMAMESEYDLIFMDCEMPVLDGFEATAQIRQMCSERRVPIIAQTARATAIDRERCLEAGMDDYMSKPIKLNALQEMLQRWLSGNASARERRPPGHGEVPKPPLSDLPPGDGSQKPILDSATISQLRSISDASDVDLFRQIMNGFLADSTRRLAALREAVRLNEGARLAAEAHALRGGGSNIGAFRLAETCRQFESIGTDGDTAVAEALIAELDEELEQVKEAVRGVIDVRS